MKTRFILGSALAAVLLLCGGTGKVMAQKNIDKMAAELEKRDDVAINSVTKRDSKTRKVVKVVKSFSFCLLYTSPSPRDVEESRMPSSA